MMKAAQALPATRRDGRLSLSVSDRSPDGLPPRAQGALVRVVPPGAEGETGAEPPGWAVVWTWHAPALLAFGTRKAAVEGPAAPDPAGYGAGAHGSAMEPGQEPGLARYAPVARPGSGLHGPAAHEVKMRALMAEGLPHEAGAGVSPTHTSAGSGCVCCTGVGGLDRFLLARAQEHVRGMGADFGSVVVLCPQGMTEPVEAMLRGSALLSAFYRMDPAPGD